MIDTAISICDNFFPAKELYLEAWGISCKNCHPVYDALYLSLAFRYNAALLTLDSKLKKLSDKYGVRTL
ncbi:MAG: hypothetical protein A2096_12305 [Spirochaetes bacterium GWF1_41_5]|nr:MAG: hypothetical protein A2096_12305 [Spirochaetes bacterium GWF1_41_5]HBE01774.1 hypothetical protein [Spirochaetia bacterium]